MSDATVRLDDRALIPAYHKPAGHPGPGFNHHQIAQRMLAAFRSREAALAVARRWAAEDDSRYYLVVELLEGEGG